MVKAETKTIQQMAIGISIGVVVALALSSAFLLAFSMAISGGRLAMESHWAIIACGVGGFFGSLFSVRWLGRRALPVGLGVGGLLFFCLTVTGFLVVKDAVLGLGQVPLLLACLGGGGLAGFAGKKHKKRRT